MSRASLGSSKRQSAASSTYEDAKLSETVTVTAASSTANSSPNPSWKPQSHPHPSPTSHGKPPTQPSALTPSPPAPTPFSLSLWDSNAAVARARRAYIKLYLPGVFYITFIILAVLSVFWGTLFRLPGRTVKGVVVDLGRGSDPEFSFDFDGGIIAQSLTRTVQSVEAAQLAQKTPRSIVSWTYVQQSDAQARFPGGVADVRRAIEEQEVFVAIAVSPGASARLLASVESPDAAYNGTLAITAFGSEGRNENAYRTYLFPHLVNTLNTFQNTFSVQFAAQHSADLTGASLQQLLQTSPQTLVLPAGFTIVNVFPFFQPIATAPVFTGLIFVLILAFFTVLVANGARLGSGLNRLLTLRSLIALRFCSAAAIYLFFSLIYSLLNLMFGVRLTHTFGHAGFVLFWLGTWIYMLAVGLVLESWVILFKQNTPFFFFPWLVVNLSVGVYPLEMLPKFYHYGYAAPYYNITRIVRTIVFGTRNSLGLNYGVLLTWVLIGTLNMSAVQWYVRRQDIMALRKAAAAASTPSDADAEKANVRPGMETAGSKS
ncbi:hypothetical protein D9619_013303 [Psilocybe cf. subviscida]|uniref:DUF3533 domain-containing protein n=1 Tax=Psilocybe cf. subviscida TaxID=2480587 RepID=A0A8H5F9G0_9AGAR|nr:hypothetical protein D9619_013303 [Psilocybe cf. subviscida]